MSDLAKRLRTLSDEFDCDNTHSMALFRDEVLKAATELERLREVEKLYKAGTEHWNPVYQVVLKERDGLRAQLTEAAAFLDQLADSLDGTLIDEPADCRAMAAKLRGET